MLPLVVFIDACGWEIIRKDPFAQRFAPHRRRLDSVFGYSSACIPSILSGRWPDDHRHWCFFVYDPERSPFRRLRSLRWLPGWLTRRRRFRRWLSRWLKVRLNFRGYFDLYNIPFEHIGLFDFTEKRSPLTAGGLNRGPNLSDFLRERQVSHFMADPTAAEAVNLEQLIRAVESEEIDFAFLYWPELDGLLHRVGNESPEVTAKLRLYERWIERLLAVAGRHYAETRLYLCSDHGMANCDRLLDLRSRINALPLRMAEDYVVVYDSTMARFWFKHERARQKIIEALRQEPLGRILDDAELAELRVLFADRYFGELIFLVDEGVLIVPSHMGDQPLRGMHGYHPSAPHSYACLCSNQAEIPAEIAAIPDLYRLMTSEALRAQAANATG
jgi:predicted AlkP superfamily pyrophosphatase or phosphodiesterase